MLYEVHNRYILFNSVIFCRSCRCKRYIILVMSATKQKRSSYDLAFNYKSNFHWSAYIRVRYFCQFLALKEQGFSLYSYNCKKLK